MASNALDLTLSKTLTMNGQLDRLAAIVGCLVDNAVIEGTCYRVQPCLYGDCDTVSFCLNELFEGGPRTQLQEKYDELAELRDPWGLY